MAHRYLILAALAASVANAAETFPSKPVRIIVPAAPGGTTDIAARMLGEKMGPELGQPVIVENRAGAAGIVGVQAFLAAPSDGHTVLMGNIGPNAINYALYKSLPYKPEDMIPITSVISNPNVLVVNPSVPAKSVKELVALAKANPGKLSFASSGRGQSVHMSGELFKLRTGIDLVHVPYKGTGPALIDVVAGQVYMIFSSLPSTMGYIRGGRLRPLAVTSLKRTPELPSVPTMQESGYRDFEVTGWFGLFASAKTPSAAIDRIYGAAKAVLAQQDIRSKFAELGGAAGGEPPEQFRKYVIAEKQKWAEVAAAARIQPE
ncbi:MAG TPA: tripartite tricarboxylate transporter substrate binding protein [Burkholderiales bacterium]|nr:tripartite tricarboxylate transporter substrate binding protein [Burkholderiales bacterium]